MKKIALVGAVLALVAGNASAVNSLAAGQLGLGVDVGNTININLGNNNNPVSGSPLISGRYFIAKDLAILGGFGFSSDTFTNRTVAGNGTVTSVDTSTTTLAVLAGIRKYLKTDDFAPFVGAVFTYGSVSGTPARSALGLAAEAGAEYFLGKQFSVEGKIRFGYSSNDNGPTNDSSSSFGTSTVGLGANFYF